MTTEESTVTEGEKKERVPFNLDIKVEERFEVYWNLFQKFQTHRNQKVRFLNKNGTARNIIDYVRDSVDRVNEYKLKPNYKDDWQNNVFDPKTRDKLIAILSTLAANRMKGEVLLEPFSLLDLDTNSLEERQSLYNSLLEKANDVNMDDQQIVWEMYTAMSEGTVIGYESWTRDVREADYIKSINPETGETKTEKIKVSHWDNVFGEIVPLDEFYPESIWVNAHDFYKKTNRAFRVQEMSYTQFVDTYDDFQNSQQVHPRNFFSVSEELPWGISDDIQPESVEVIQFFDALNDKMGIWANGVEIYWGPMPWNHKKLPFWVAIFEMVHHQFLYGKSLPDKLMGMQDVNNAVLNAMLDQLFLALNSPIFIDGVSDLDEGYMEPGRIYELEKGSKVQRGDLGKVDQTAFQMYTLLQRSMEESSVSAQFQGVPTGGRKTKFEVQQLQESALNLAGLFLTLMETAVGKKYWLRMHNILQYYSMPNVDAKGDARFKFISVDGTKLTNGKRGKRLIQVVGSKKDIPSKDSLRELVEQQTGQEFDPTTTELEPIVLTKDYFKNKSFDLTMKIVANSSVKDSQALKDQKTVGFYQATKGDPLFNQEETAKNFTKAMGQPQDVIAKKQEQPQGPPGLEGLLGGGEGGGAQQPEPAGQQPQQIPGLEDLG